MNYLYKQILAPCLAIGALLVSSPAWGFTYTTTANIQTPGYGNPDATNLLTVGISTLDVGNNFTLFYDVPNLSSLGNALTAKAVIKISDFSYNSTTNKTTLLLNITLANTIASGDTARITSFGMVLDPNATNASIDQITGPFDDIDTGALPAFSIINQCAFGGPNCQGGGNSSNSILAGNSASFLLEFLYDGNMTGTSINISQFPIKWQSALGGCSYETSPNAYGEEIFATYSTPDNTNCSGGTPTPEPESIFLIMGGLGFITFLSRRLRVKK